MSAFINAKEFFCKIMTAFLIFLTLNVFAKPASVDMASSQLRAHIDELAKKRDLNTTEWLEFVKSLDTKCDKESDPVRKENICSLYYEVYKTGDLFSDSTPSLDDCLRAKVTMEGLSRNPETSKSLLEIVEKLCPTK